MKIPLLTLARNKFVYVLLTLIFLALVYRDFLMTYFFFQFLVNLYLFQKNASLETGTREV